MKTIASLCLLSALAGCGNKGPLVMADPASRDAPTAVSAPPATPEPASTEPVPAEPVPSTSGTPAR